MHVQVPEKGEHQTSNYGLKQQLLIAEQSLNQAEYEEDTNRHQEQSRQLDQNVDQASEEE